MYCRPPDLSIKDFLIEYENKCFEIKEFRASVSNDVLWFRLIKAANLTPDKEELISNCHRFNIPYCKSKQDKVYNGPWLVESISAI